MFGRQIYLLEHLRLEKRPQLGNQIQTLGLISDERFHRAWRPVDFVWFPHTCPAWILFQLSSITFHCNAVQPHALFLDSQNSSTVSGIQWVLNKYFLKQCMIDYLCSSLFYAVLEGTFQPSPSFEIFKIIVLIPFVPKTLF